MQRDYNHILLLILTIINYTNNKGKFVEKFDNLNYAETFINLLDNLPEDKQEEVKTSIKTPEDIKKYIPEESFDAELAKVSQAALDKFIEEISPALTLTQKEQINNLLQQ